MPRRNWKQVSIPKEMYDEIKRLIEEHPELGYRSVSAFVATACRELLKIEKRYLRPRQDTSQDDV